MQDDKFKRILFIYSIIIILTAIISLIVVILFVDSKQKGCLKNKDISNIHILKNNNVNKKIKFEGKISKILYKENITKIYINKNNIKMVINYEGKKKFNTLDVIIVDGIIKKTSKKDKKIYINSNKIYKINTKEHKYNINEKINKNHIIITIKQVIFLPKETMIFLRVENNSNIDFKLYSHSSKIYQLNNEYNTIYSINEIDIPSIISKNNNYDGVIVFSNISILPFKLLIKSNSNDFIFDINI